MKKITVTVSNGGEVEVDIDGMVGNECQQYIDTIKKALGGEVIKDEKKPEFYQSQGTTVKAKR